MVECFRDNAFIFKFDIKRGVKGREKFFFFIFMDAFEDVFEVGIFNDKALRASAVEEIEEGFDFLDSIL